jgi:hypothetical protein
MGAPSSTSPREAWRLPVSSITFTNVARGAPRQSNNNPLGGEQPHAILRSESGGHRFSLCCHYDRSQWPSAPLKMACYMYTESH